MIISFHSVTPLAYLSLPVLIFLSADRRRLPRQNRITERCGPPAVLSLTGTTPNLPTRESPASLVDTSATPSPRHAAAIEPILRYLSIRTDHGPTYTTRGPLRMSFSTDSVYAADHNTRQSVTDLMNLASGETVTWTTARQHTVSHSSTEVEFISYDTGARELTWLASLAH